jgi:hypothetical protein
MIPVTNQQQLTLIINQILQDILEQIAFETGKELQQYVQREWYEAHSPEMYQRTYDLLNSIVNSKVEQKGSKFEVSVYFDRASITPNFLGGGKWNEHMGFDGAIFTEGLIETIEEGNLSPYSKSYARKGIHMVQETAMWLAENLPKIAMRIFRKNGIDVVIT